MNENDNKLIPISKQLEIKNDLTAKWQDHIQYFDHLRNKWYTLEGFDDHQRNSIAQKEKQEKEIETKNVFKRAATRFGESREKRTEQFGEVGETLMSGEDIGLIGWWVQALKTIGGVVWTVGDVIGNAVISVADAAVSLVDTTGEKITWFSIKEWAKEAANNLANTDLGQQWLKSLASWMENYSVWAQENPDIADSLEAVFDIASVVPIGKAWSLTAQWVTKWTKAAAKVVTSPWAQKALQAWTKVAGKVAEWVTDAAKWVWKTASNVGEFAANKLIGINKATRKLSVDDPDLIKDIELGKITRETEANALTEIFESKKESLSFLGKEYETLIDAANISVDLNTAKVNDILDGYSIGIKNWVLDFSKSGIWSKTSRNLIQDAYGMIKEKWVVDAKTLHNTRKQIDDVMKREMALTPEGKRVIEDLRDEVDNIIRRKMPEIKTLDKQYAPLREEVNKIAKEWFNKDWTMKDTTPSKIANLAKINNAPKLKRLEEIMPGITRKVKWFAAMEDITSAMNRKMWLYMQWWLFWWGITSIAAWTMARPLAIGAAIAINPKVVVWVLARYGKLKKNISKLSQKILSNRKLSNQEQSILYKEVAKLPSDAKEEIRWAMMKQQTPWMDPKFNKKQSTPWMFDQPGMTKTTSNPMQPRGTFKPEIEPKIKTPPIKESISIPWFNHRTLVSLIKESRKLGRVPGREDITAWIIDKLWFLDRSKKIKEVEKFISNQLWFTEKPKVDIDAKKAEKIKKRLERKKKQEKEWLGYWIDHRPTKTWAGWDDITKGGELVPEDIYTNPEYYFNPKDKAYQESYKVIKAMRGKPDKDVTIYRAGARNEFNEWDWISLSKAYAQEHADRMWSKWVYSMKVKAKDIQFAGDDINEFGYFPKKPKQTPLHKEANK